MARGKKLAIQHTGESSTILYTQENSWSTNQVTHSECIQSVS